MPVKKLHSEDSCNKIGKDYNALTNLCVKKCGPNQSRDPTTFKCKKQGNTTESCKKQGKDYNAKTKRCVKMCGPKQTRDPTTFKCKKHTAKPYRFDSLLRFVKKHPAKINEKELENRNNHIINELRLMRKSINKNDIQELEQKQQQIEREIEKLDYLMNENVNNNLIIENQEDVANKIDHLEYMMDQLSAASMSSTISTIKSSEYNTPL